MHDFVRYAILVAAFVIMPGCSDYREGDIAQALPNYPFSILIIGHHDIDTLPYDYKSEIWGNLLRNPPSGNILVADKEIESYDWQRQTLLLTRSASLRFSKEYIRGLNEKLFMVSLGNEPAFAGSFIELASARAIRYPVIYISRKGQQVVFCIRPEHSLSLSRDNIDQSLMERLAPTKMKEYFRRNGKLRKLTEKTGCR